MNKLSLTLILLIMISSSVNMQNRPRARELGITVGVLPTGPLNAITDVKGARSGAVAEGSVGAGTGTIAFGFKGAWKRYPWTVPSRSFASMV